MINISLLEFIKTGNFGSLRERVGREEILALLGPPDEFSCNPSEEESVYVLLPGGGSEYRPATEPRERDHAGIWFYGDFEIHFTKRAVDAVAWMVYTDHFDQTELSGGASLKVDPWVIEKGLRLDSFLEQLKEAQLDSMEPEHVERQETMKVELPSGAVALFLTDEDPPDWQIHALFRILPKPDPDPNARRPLPDSP